jgi:uncharacterized membrane protein
MMPYGWHDGSWGIVWMVMSWVAIVVLVCAIVWAIRPGARGAERPRNPKEILRERFARGEIDGGEYRSRLDALDADRRVGTR